MGVIEARNLLRRGRNATPKGIDLPCFKGEWTDDCCTLEFTKHMLVNGSWQWVTIKLLAYEQDEMRRFFNRSYRSSRKASKKRGG